MKLVSGSGTGSSFVSLSFKLPKINISLVDLSKGQVSVSTLKINKKKLAPVYGTCESTFIQFKQVSTNRSL